MYANIMNTQIFYFDKYDRKGHRSSQKVTFILKIHFHYISSFSIKFNLIKTLYDFA